MGSGAGFFVHGDLERTKKRRAKRTFDKNIQYYKDEGIKEEFPKATEAQLEAIREKIKKQQRLDKFKLIVAFVLAIPLSLGVLIGIIYLLTS
ncbi:hypothetical protein [Kordia sp.]|uniref:hypothetical protein n=1 Tax=Kordia sp. TaxID=1965332 RepID=UPI003D27D5A4